MRASLRLAVHRLTAHWRGWLVLALLVGMAGGATLAAAAGARRTETAYPRFLTWSRASNMLVAPAGPGTGGFDAALARLPHAAAVAPEVGLNLEPVNPRGQLDGDVVVVAPLDRRFGTQVDRPRLLAGRLPPASKPREVAIDQHGAAELHLQVGGYLRLAALPNSPGPVPRGAAGHLRMLRLRVVGILVTRASIDPVTDLDKAPLIIASLSLWRELGPKYEAFSGAEVRLHAGTAVATFGREAQALARRFPSTHGQIYQADEGAQAATVERSIRPASVALWLFALALAVSALLVVGQAVSRLMGSASADNQALSALGATRGQLTAACLIDVAAAGALGAVLAVVLAFAVSPLMPIGVARLAEPEPGLSADAAVFAIGGPVIVLLLLARAFWPARRLAAARVATIAAAGPLSRSRLADGLAGLGVPVTVSTGVRLALEPGRGRTAVPVRAVLAGTTLSVLAVTGAHTFGANLVHLVQEPRLYGRAWDAAVDLQFGSMSKARTAALFAADPQIARWSFGDHGVISIGRNVVPAIGVAAGHGRELSPTLLEGRPPRASDEIVLGTSTLQQAGKRVGQWVTAVGGGRRQRYYIVGRAVFPNFGQGSFTPTDLGQGAETTTAALASQVNSAAGPGFEFVLVRFKPGVDKPAATARFERLLHPICVAVQQSTCVVTGQEPNGITDYARIDATPMVLGGVLALLGLAVLAQLIVMSGRRRRRDFAVLRALGMARFQVSSITAWQVSTLAVLALAAGLPLGVAAGRRSWALFGDLLGVPASAITPVGMVLLAVPAVVLLANAAAFLPGRRAANVRAADVLRVE